MNLQDIFYNWVSAQDFSRSNAALAVPVRSSQSLDIICYPLPGICQNCGSNPAIGLDESGAKLCGGCLAAVSVEVL